jgi:hypothetical protein
VGPVVASSDLITSLEEARACYRARLVGTHTIQVRRTTATIVFERRTTHLYSEDVDAPAEIEPCNKVVRYLPRGRIELRRFSLDRARLLDCVLPALQSYTYSLPGLGPRGHDNRLVHGPRLADGRYMRVVLSPRRDRPRYYGCVSAYPIREEFWLAGRRAKTARFP